MRFILFIFLGTFGLCSAQSAKDSIQSPYESTLSLHPLGIFISRINHNFKIHPEKAKSISFNYSSGNIWLPKVTAYEPLIEKDRLFFENLAWHERAGPFNPETMPAKSQILEADGVIRMYQLAINTPITDNQELNISARLFSLDAGKTPFSLFTSDQFIEWFHSNIAGGEDPFARKYYGFNSSKINYKDKDNRTLEVPSNKLFLTGLDLSYFYYPKIISLESRRIYTNAGVHLGINSSSSNPSIDLGINTSIVKSAELSRKLNLQFGLGFGALRQKILATKNGVQLFTRKSLFSSEAFVNLSKNLNNGGIISLGTSYVFQSAYNKPFEFDEIVLIGQRVTTHWHYALSHLYRPLTANSFGVTYQKGNLTLSAYFREDFLVDNAPDSQVGIKIKYLLIKYK